MITRMLEDRVSSLEGRLATMEYWARTRPDDPLPFAEASAQPAQGTGLPAQPSEPAGEVTTERLDGCTRYVDTPTGLKPYDDWPVGRPTDIGVVMFYEAKPAVIADIRANIARATADRDREAARILAQLRQQHEADAARLNTDKARIDSLRDQLAAMERRAESAEHDWRAARAELETVKAKLAELRRRYEDIDGHNLDGNGACEPDCGRCAEVKQLLATDHAEQPAAADGEGGK